MKKKNRGKIVSYILLFGISILMLFPFFWMVRSSFMTNREIMTTPIQWLPSHYNLDNFRDAFARAPFSRYFVNSAVIVLINMAGSILSSSFIAFGFSRLRFVGKNLWFALLLSTMMIPQTVLMIPQFLIWQAVGAYNTFVPLTLPCFFGSAFHVIYLRIIVPMAKPVLCTVGVFTFMNTWNDFMGPLLYLDKENLKTVSLALQNFMGQHVSEWNLMMALSSVITLPMIAVYFMAQRYFIEGITFSGLKG